MFLSAVSLVQTGAGQLMTMARHSGGHLRYLADDVTMKPSGIGIPGGKLVQQIINWAGQYGLWVSLIAMLIGGAVYGVSTYGGNSYQGSRGRTVALAGAAGAIIIGLAPSAINVLFKAANA